MKKFKLREENKDDGSEILEVYLDLDEANNEVTVCIDGWSILTLTRKGVILHNCLDEDCGIKLAKNRDVVKIRNKAYC